MEKKQEEETKLRARKQLGARNKDKGKGKARKQLGARNKDKGKGKPNKKTPKSNMHLIHVFKDELITFFGYPPDLILMI